MPRLKFERRIHFPIYDTHLVEPGQIRFFGGQNIGKKFLTNMVLPNRTCFWPLPLQNDTELNPDSMGYILRAFRLEVLGTGLEQEEYFLRQILVNFLIDKKEVFSLPGNLLRKGRPFTQVLHKHNIFEVEVESRSKESLPVRAIIEGIISVNAF